MITYGPRFLIDDQIAIIRGNVDKTQKNLRDIVFNFVLVSQYAAAKCFMMHLWCPLPPSRCSTLYPTETFLLERRHVTFNFPLLMFAMLALIFLLLLQRHFLIHFKL
jgi:hypothetical protein